MTAIKKQTAEKVFANFSAFLRERERENMYVVCACVYGCVCWESYRKREIAKNVTTTDQTIAFNHISR